MRLRLYRKPMLLALALVVLAGLGVSGWWYERYSHRLDNSHRSAPLDPVVSASSISDSYDVIVAGTDPEGVSAAVSAARNGLKVLLVDSRDRSILGGLATVGGLNVLDQNYSPQQSKLFAWFSRPKVLNKGIFLEWYDQLEGNAFDIATAANALYAMVKKEPNIDLLMKVKDWTPIVDTSGARPKVTGLKLTKADGSAVAVRSEAVIDATQDGDIYAAAGASFTLGREDIGDKTSVMASTLIFKLSGVTQKIWEEMGKHPNTGIDRMSIWGYRDAAQYKSSDPSKVRLRGLNIGRQNDGTILINAMQLFNVNPLDPESVRQGIAVGEKEAPLIADYLIKNFKEFKDLKYAGTETELYTRESRHLIGEYRLSIADVMENRTHWDDIAYGSYPVDIQSTSDGAIGTTLMKPQQYGVPFRALVPADLDGLLAVGRSASYDTVPHGSARVIPLGMATGQAAGAAAKLAIERGISFAELSQSPELIAELRERLEAQGMDLKPKHVKTPGYMKDKQYEGLLAAAGMYLASGGLDNKGWALDEPANIQRFYNNIRHIVKLHPEAFRGDSASLLKGAGNADKLPLTLNQAAYIILKSLERDPSVTKENALDVLQQRGLVTQKTLDTIADRNRLTNGDDYMLIRDLAVNGLGLSFGEDKK